MNTWNWQIFLQDTGGGYSYLDWLISAWGWTLSVALLSLVVALFTGAVVGIIRTLPSRGWVFAGNVWTELFRNIPLLVQIFLWYHVVPAFFPVFKQFPSFLLVVFALGFFTSARIAEQVKAGIESLPRGQRYAGLAMGLSLAQTYRYVLLPMAFRVVIPPLTSEAMNLIKNSSVAFAVSIAELTLFALQAGEETNLNTQMYLVVSLLYFVSAFAINRAMLYVEQRVRVPGMVAA